MIPIYIKQLKNTINKNDLINLRFLFSLPIDTSKINDYTISYLDLEDMYIIVKDSKTNTTYIVKDTELGNIYGRKITIKKDNIEYKYSYAYDNYKRELVRTTILVHNQNKTLEVEIEHPNTMEIFTHDHQTISIRYYLHKKIVYSKTYRNYLNTFYKEENLYSDTTSYNKYLYNLNNNIIYGLNNLESFNNFFHLRGICALDNNKYVINYLPYTINKTFYKNTLEKYNSILYFESFSNLDIYSITITKDNKELKCHYKVKNNQGQEIEVKGIIISPLTPGLITIEELNKINNYLEYLTTICDERFIITVKNEINTFINLLTHNPIETFNLKDFNQNYLHYLNYYSHKYDNAKLTLEKTLNFK